MKLQTATLLLSLTGVTLTATPLYAQAQNSKAKKTATSKPPAVASQTPVKKKAIVLGTTQLPGDFGEFGQTYTIGKYEPINITLNRAEYQIGRFNVEHNSHVPDAEQKLLVLHYTIHNPNPSEQRFYWGSLKFMAVDKKDVNHEFIQAVTREGTTEPVDVTLKPAQKLEVQSALLVPAESVVPKLILQREEGAPVVRYDLRGKVAPLPAPFADPADSTGATVLKTVPAQKGTFYPLGIFDARLDDVVYTNTPLGNRDSASAPEEGQRYIALTFTLKNATNAQQRYYWGTFAAGLTDADGETVEWNQTLLKGTRNEWAEGHLQPGQEIRLRFFYALPNAVAAKQFTLALPIGNNNTFALAYDLSTVK